ncbi:hypothetical protein P0F11_003044 [Vibrio metschnikovii]|nr:hypothetical protein [Vibrio metschnikovii]
MKKDLEKILIDAASSKLNFTEELGIKGGHNGPYFDQETPVRNTSHWLIVFCYLFKKTHQEQYKLAALKAINFLQSEKSRPMNSAFFCRTKKEKDFCNGLMGQAWAIEALIYAYRTFEDEALYNLAEKVFLCHDFDKKRYIWYRTNVDGSKLSHDETFNHQLWFCAVGSLLTKSPEVLNQCDAFFEKIAINPGVYRSGVIFHNTSIYKWDNEIRCGFKSIIDNIYRNLVNLKNRRAMYSKSVGYHGFNLYAFELLKERYHSHNFFKGKKFKSMLEVTLSDSFIEDLNTSKYSYGYNPPGFEIGFSLLSNGYGNGVAQDYLIRHFDITKDDVHYNSAVSQDVETSEARLYEAVRILDFLDVNFEQQ